MINKLKTIKLTPSQLFAIGLSLFFLGILGNFSGIILHAIGVLEKIPLSLSVCGCPFIFIGSMLLTKASKRKSKEAIYELDWFYNCKELARDEERQLRFELLENERVENRGAIELDAFGYSQERYFHFGRFKLYVTPDCPYASVQKVSPMISFDKVHLLRIEKITRLEVIGGEPLEHLEPTIKLLGAFHKIFGASNYYGRYDYVRRFSSILLWTSTTDLKALLKFVYLEGLIDGLVYIPYNQSSIDTLLKFTKCLNSYYPKDYTVLPKNKVYLLPSMKSLLTQEDITLLKTRWSIDYIRNIEEIERLKGNNIRKLQNFITN